MPHYALADAKLANIDDDKPAGAQIFNIVKFAILRMDLAPGRVLSESELGKHFGASRTPVREAIMQLRDAGLVKTRPSRGNYVTKISELRIREAQFLREAIELACVNRVCEIGLSTQSRVELSALLDKQRAAIANDDDVSFTQFDDEFHLVIAMSTGFDRAAHVLEREKMQLDRLRVLALRDKQHLAGLVEEHESILQALINNDADRATSQMRKHLQSVLHILSTVMRDYADYIER